MTIPGFQFLGLCPSAQLEPVVYPILNMPRRMLEYRASYVFEAHGRARAITSEPKSRGRNRRNGGLRNAS